MNRINPLYIGLLILVVLLMLLFNLSGAKSDLAEAKESYKETTQLAVKLSALKDVYGAKNKTKISIEKILKQSTLKASEIKKDIKTSSITISSENMDVKALNFLLGKLLNGAYNISSLNVKKLSENKATLNVEIKL